MRNFMQADLKMLEHLMEWNDQRGRTLHIEVRKVQQQWVVTFLGCAEGEPASQLAQFTGDSEEVLERWAKSIIWRYEKRKQHRETMDREE